MTDLGQPPIPPVPKAILDRLLPLRGRSAVLVMGRHATVLASAGLSCTDVPVLRGHSLAVVDLDDKNASNRVAIARGSLKRRGRLVVVTAADRLSFALELLAAQRLEPKLMFLVHQDLSLAPDSIWLLASAAKPGGLDVMSVVAG